MPNGKTHDKITYAFTPILGAACLGLYNNLTFAIIFVAAFLFSSLMFNGDLDIKSSPYGRWWIFRHIWKPYQNMFSHRSIWTHGVIIGTIVRLLYLSPLILGVLYLFGFSFSFGNVNWSIVIPILFGLEVGNSIHTLSDKIW